MATRDDWFDGKAAETYANLLTRREELISKRSKKKQERIDFIKAAAAAVTVKKGVPLPPDAEAKRRVAMKNAHLAMVRANEYDSEIQVINKQIKDAPEWLKNAQ